MAHENLILEIDGDPATDLYPDLIGLDVELDDELAGMFRLRLAIRQQPDGLWTHLDEERLRIWKEVVIGVGFEDGVEDLFTGTITHVKPDFGPDRAACTLEIWGMDRSVLLDREEKLKAWPNKKDSDIAAEIFDLYALTPEVEDTEVVHDEAVSTIIQRETDMQFLKRLALRNGYECYVEGETGYFRPPQVDAAPQPVLAVHFGGETNVNRFAIEVDALRPANVTMYQVDRANKEILTALAESSQRTALGDTTYADLLATGMARGRIVIGANGATGLAEMNALAQGLLEEAEWFVTGEGEVAANQYGHVLRPRGLVAIKGIGASYSGIYYVTHVTHTFDGDGYVQSFQVKRNAILPTGAEDFAGGSGGLLNGLI